MRELVRHLYKFMRLWEIPFGMDAVWTTAADRDEMPRGSSTTLSAPSKHMSKEAWSLGVECKEFDELF